MFNTDPIAGPSPGTSPMAFSCLLVYSKYTQIYIYNRSKRREEEEKEDICFIYTYTKYVVRGAAARPPRPAPLIAIIAAPTYDMKYEIYDERKCEREM